MTDSLLIATVANVAVQQVLLHTPNAWTQVVQALAPIVPVLIGGIAGWLARHLSIELKSVEKKL